jgi:signal transduction histidine kinase
MTRWLRTRVEEREAELGIAHQREQQLVRATAHHDERRRIMRDLHDGLGSQLMAMLLAARMGDAEPKGVAEGLQSVVDEMRLMVDSMDSAGDSLASALAIFRQRITPQIQSVGVALQWEDSTDGPVEGFGPRDVLQIFRILQEAATNALKHASASEIGILISPGQNESTIDISVSDNGRGFDVIDQAAGRGLRNMRARAKTVGGEIVVSPRANGGTTMRLTLPIPSDQTVETHTLAEETAA